MDCESYGDITVVGNFAQLLDSKPEPFDYNSTAKWLEDYPLEWREVWGGTICSCQKLEVHYAPYYGWDYYHLDGCNLIRKLADNPGMRNLFDIRLPSVTHYADAVPVDAHVPLYIKHRSTKPKKINITIKLPQLSLL